MREEKKRSVAILGATGMVGRRFAELLINHPWFELVTLVGDKSVNESYESVWERKEAQLQRHYGGDYWSVRPFPEALRGRRVASFEELLNSTSVDLVFSSIHANYGHLESELINRGFTVISNSPHRRLEEGVPLIVTEVNGDLIESQQYIKNPNCVTSGLALTVAPIIQRYGLREISIVTFQSLSGRGDAKYSQDLVVGNIYSLHGSEERTEEFIVGEIHKLFRDQIAISVSCNRVFVQEGHLVDVKLKTVDRISGIDEIARMFGEFDPIRHLKLPSGRHRPLHVTFERGRPRPRHDASHGNGFTVCVGGICVEDRVYDLRYQFVVNNVVRGAAGGAILNAEMYHLRSLNDNGNMSDKSYWHS
jgi:aspartate-semialdehyde dehydrogenase